MSSGKKAGDGSRRAGLLRAFDEIQFGPAKTLNLRESLPTVEAARKRAESWLRERQVAGEREVLVITGRGNSSPGGRSPVREGVLSTFPLLRRKGIVAQWREHSPGSFEVVLAPLSALFEAPRRKKDAQAPRTKPPPPTLAGLSDRALASLRYLAQRSLESLGVREIEGLVESEMLDKFAALTYAGIRTDAEIVAAVERALSELDG